MTVTGKSSMRRAALSAISLPATCASLIRNGAPAATATRKIPVACGSETGTTARMRTAQSGTRTKLASSARMTARPRRSGPSTSSTVCARPTENMLPTANTITETSTSVERKSSIGADRSQQRSVGPTGQPRTFIR